MAELNEERWVRYGCKTCDGQFVIPDDETAVCCPICRMGRIEVVE